MGQRRQRGDLRAAGVDTGGAEGTGKLHGGGELSDAYNLVVLGAKSASVRESLDDAQKSVKRETQRKLEEFGYIENGEMVKEYEVPTVDKVREIIEKSKEAK